MRIKVILTASALGLCVAAVAVHFRYSPEPPPATTEVGASDGASPAPAPAAPAASRTQIGIRPQEALPLTQDSRADLSSPDHADYVLERKSQLIDLTTSNDPNALRTILSELNNPDPEIRKAALSAVVQVGSQDAIPALKNQLAWAEDPQEKVDIQDAIDFLQLPSAEQVKNEAMAAQNASPPPATENN